MATPPQPVVICSHCGAENKEGAETCWMCKQPVVLWIGPEEPSQIATSRQAASSRTFRLSSLMLIIALVAVCLGVSRELPGIGIVLMIVVTPAFARTLVAVGRRKAKGRPMTPLEKIAVFWGSLGVVTLIGLAALAAFVITCFPVGGALAAPVFPVGLITAVAFGVVAAAAVAIPMIRRLWPRKD